MKCSSGLVGLFTVIAVACGSSSSEFDGPAAGRAGKGGSSGSAGRGGSAGAGATGTGGSGAGTTGGAGGGGGTTGGSENTTGGAAGDDASGGARAGRGGTGNNGASGGRGGQAQGGRGGSAQAGAPSGGVEIDDAPAEVAIDLCDKIYECCTADEIMGIQGIGTSKGQCELAVALFVQLQVSGVKPAIAAGRVVYDGTALDHCLTDYGDQSCDMLRGIESFECEGLILPQQAIGEPCGVSPECIDGYCDGGGSAQTPDGECAALKANGADCAANAECESKLCDASGTCAEPSSSALCGG